MSELDKISTIRKGCVAAAATIIAAKWNPQLLYALACGPKRFGELQKNVGGVNPRTLSARLDELECQGIITKKTYAEVPPRIEYTLTEKGQDLIPILECMIDWGEKHPPLKGDVLRALKIEVGE